MEGDNFISTLFSSYKESHITDKLYTIIFFELFKNVNYVNKYYSIFLFTHIFTTDRMITRGWEFIPKQTITGYNLNT